MVTALQGYDKPKQCTSEKGHFSDIETLCYCRRCLSLDSVIVAVFDALSVTGVGAGVGSARFGLGLESDQRKAVPYLRLPAWVTEIAMIVAGGKGHVAHEPESLVHIGKTDS
jgi:hypothetical protein